MDYKQAGVDIAAGDALVEWLQESSGQTDQPFAKNLLSGIGGFASLFRFQFPEIQNPCLVASTDGVGTKVKLAVHFKKFAGVGQDLVAMCVNDVICCGANPLFFLDYYAVGELQLDFAKEFLQGVRAACSQAGCLLVGGETAEMPGVYQKGDFDCAGFVVGVVDEKKTLGAHRVCEGDQLIGIASSGFHSNGFSLLRKVFADDLEEWRDILLTPTSLYPSLANKLFSVSGLHALAHITGGGIENIPRVIPREKMVRLKPWAWPEPFVEVQRRTNMSPYQMLTTLNCGIGLVAVVDPKDAPNIRLECETQGFTTFDIGAVVNRGAKDLSSLELPEPWR